MSRDERDIAYVIVRRVLNAVRESREREGYEESRALDEERYFRVKWMWGENRHGPVYLTTLERASEARDAIVARSGEPMPREGVPAGRKTLRVYIEKFDGRHNWVLVPEATIEAVLREDSTAAEAVPDSSRQREEERVMQALLERLTSRGGKA